MSVLAPSSIQSMAETSPFLKKTVDHLKDPLFPFVDVHGHHTQETPRLRASSSVDKHVEYVKCEELLKWVMYHL